MLTRGYTLLEMLVVILLLGLVTGLAIPRLDRMFGSMRFAYDRDEAMESIGALVFEAHTQRRDFELNDYPPAQDTGVPLELPEGWHLKTDHPIRFRSNGVCSGGIVTLRYESRSMKIRLAPPLCQPEEV